MSHRRSQRRNALISESCRCMNGLIRMRAILVFGLVGSALFSASAQCQNRPPKFEIGPLFTFLRVPSFFPINEQNQAELGGRFTWNVKSFFAIEAEAETSPFSTPFLYTAYQGGYLSQAFVGVKAGKRWNRFGLFAKFRPGLNSYSDAIKRDLPPASLAYGRRTDPAFDVGGAFEIYISARLLLRYDAGNTIIDYRSSHIASPIGPVPSPGAVRNNFQFSTAVVFRF